MEQEEYLEMIREQLQQGQSLYAVEVNGTVLTKEYWLSHLLKRKAFAKIHELWKKYSDRLEKLHTSQGELVNKIKVFVSDLMAYKDVKDARKRLEQELTADFYMSTVYFTAEEAEFLLSFPGFDGKTLREKLQEMVQSKGYELCTSHSLAPLFVSFFGIDKNFQHTSQFKSTYRQFKQNWSKQQKK